MAQTSPTMDIQVDFRFSAAHRLPRSGGRCRNQHGHNYRLRVVLSGDPDPEKGWIADFDEVLDRVGAEVIGQLEGSDLNEILENPTAEMIVGWIWERVASLYPQLSELQLWETPDCSVRYRGPKGG